jgi:hypothetical protein
LPVAAFLLVGWLGAPNAVGQQSASTPVVAAQASPAPSAEDQRAQRLHADAAHLNDLAQQLQLALHKAGEDKLSLETVRLAQQVQLLSRQIQAELRQP